MVTGRDCSSQRWPSVPTAHSTSCGPPKTCATCLDRATRRRRSVAGSWGPSPRVNSTTLAFPSRRYREPSTSPLTRGSGPPSTADTVHRSVRPVTGSTPNSTPPCRGSISGWTRTAIGVPATPARSLESRTVCTASAKAGNPEMPMIESNCPAIEEPAVSSSTDELRATRDCSSPPASSKARRSAGCSPRCAGSASMAAVNTVVSTTPGSVLTPATDATASAAALLPVRLTSVARSSLRVTSSGPRRPSSGSSWFRRAFDSAWPIRPTSLAGAVEAYRWVRGFRLRP